jgi:hypothetical protein
MVLVIALWTTAAVACTSIAHNQAASHSATTTRSSTGRPTTGGTAHTSTSKPAVTTTTGLGPIALANQAIGQWARSRQGSTAVSIGDVDDGVVTDLGAVPQIPVRIASVMKVSIAIAFLRTLHEQGRGPTADEMDELTGMIEESDNDDATALWNASDGPEGLQVTENAAGMTNTAFQTGHGWGFSLTTAHDQAKLQAKLAGGSMLDASDTALVLHLMRSVVSSEQWGFADVVDPSFEPAIKNGWYEDTDAPVWRIHCTAIFDTPKLKHRFSIAVFTRYPATLGMGYGEDTCRGVAHRLGAWLT